ncbi:hypothetical protein [Catenulispora sp. GP43]|uniref:hypothetical protein n=1 Tax=Catenulispora sp. GP43 TaxID=3156263 RepID=UPI0035125D67
MTPPRSVIRKAWCSATSGEERSWSAGQFAQPVAGGRGTSAVTPFTVPTVRASTSGCRKSRAATSTTHGATSHRSPAPVERSSTAPPEVTSESSARVRSSRTGSSALGLSGRV